LNGGDRDGLSLFANTGIRPVCACSESTYPNEDQVEDLQSMCNFICVLYDNDDAGRKMTARLLDKYPYFIPINISEITNCNDISDYCEWCLKNEQKNQLTTLINEALERYILQSIAY
jgi:DNA primase